MESPCNESQPADVPAPAPAPAPTVPPPAPEPGPVGILLCRDLIFTTKVRGTADELGYRLLVVSNVSLARAMIEKWRPRVVFVDLTAQDLAAPAALFAY